VIFGRYKRINNYEEVISNIIRATVMFKKIANFLDQNANFRFFFSKWALSMIAALCLIARGESQTDLF